MLSKYKLYNIAGGEFNLKKIQIKKILKILFYCDGTLSNKAISRLTSIKINEVNNLMKKFEKKKIVQKII